MKLASCTSVYCNYSLGYAINDLANIGYQGIEIWAGRPHMFRNDLDEQMQDIVSLLKQTNLQVCNFLPATYKYPLFLCSENEAVRRDGIGYLKSCIDSAVKVGSPTVCACTAMINWDSDYESGKRVMVKSCDELGEYAFDKNIRLLIEPSHRFDNNPVTYMDDALKLIEVMHYPVFGILIDTGHIHINGESLKECIGKCHGLPYHVHVNDNDGSEDAHRIPGRGTFDFQSAAEILTAEGYGGFVSLELSSHYCDSASASCRESYQLLKKWFAE